ncbi:MAG: hypothetical protein NT079_02675, partial [Candidatus Omnitrophica bacterium]|nr:hypothetical protein [Candidatus Omnitrophota bacterium]
MQDYLNSGVWEEVLPQERIFLILMKMQEIGIPCVRFDRDAPVDVYSFALPYQVSENLTKNMVPFTRLSYQT